jgi:hypothetical protein
MDPVLDRVRAADPVQPGEFAGLADFDALVLEPRPRRRRKWFVALARGQRQRRGLRQRAGDLALRSEDRQGHPLRRRPHGPERDLPRGRAAQLEGRQARRGHSWGLDAQGKPFDETYVETVREFHTLPDTPSNRKQLELTTRP